MTNYSRFAFDPQQDKKTEFSQLAHMIMEVEYLIILLVVLFVAVPGSTVSDRPSIIFTSLLCTLGIIIFHYFTHENITKKMIRVEICALTVYITYILFLTGKSESPLVNLYLVVVISSALMLGRLTSILLVVAITAILLYFDLTVHQNNLFSVQHINNLMRTLVTLYTFLLGSYLVITLASYMERIHARFQGLSEHDELSGLLNMRAFANLLIREKKQAERHQRQFSVLMIDADNLKHVNDTYGHVAGDRLIMSLADIMRCTMRVGDVVARYGGDEFIILLPETDAIGAIDCAERLRKRVEVAEFFVSSQEKAITSTISVGVATFPADGITPEEIINKADRALYQCKKQGKNRAIQAEIVGTNFVTEVQS